MNRIESFFTTSLIATFSLGLLACDSTVDLTKEKIRDVQFVISQDVIRNGVVPSKTYSMTLKITVEKSDGKLEVIDNEDIIAEQIRWTGDNLTFGGGQMKVSPNNLNAWQTGYTVEAKILGNAYPAITMHFGTHWAAFNELSYVGPVSGSEGGNGGNGPNLVIHSARVESSEAKWRLMKIVSSAQESVDWVLVPEANRLAIKSVGGAGRTGSYGRDGVQTWSYDSESQAIVYSCAYPATHGSGGGNGGNGGNVHYGYYSEQSQFAIALLSLGGAGGAGGGGGSVIGACTVAGNNGHRGSDGGGGTVTSESSSRAEIEALFGGVDLNGVTIID